MSESLQLNLNTEPDRQRISKPPAPEEALPTFVEGRSKKKAANKEGQKAKGDGSASNNSSTNVISSLFKHNPDIPELPLQEVKPVKEPVFSSRSFSECGVHPFLAKNLSDMGFAEMTEVQHRTVPMVLSGKDALVKSQTGSGKTLAYALPIIHKLEEIRPKLTRSDGVHALVIVPTRELAVQTLELFSKLCQTFTHIVPCAIAGGEKKKSEKARLRKGVHVLIATPGRLLDHLERTKCLSMLKLKFLVFDEADRMLELGYEKDVTKILEVIKRQSGDEQQVSMQEPVFVDVADEDASDNTIRDEQSVDNKSLTCPENLKQTFILCPAKLRLVTLAAFLLWKCRYSKARKVLIFMSTQDMVDYHLELFQRALNGRNSKVQKPKKLHSKLSGLKVTKDAKEILTSDAFDTEKESEPEESIFSRPGDKDMELLKLHGSMGQKERMDVFRTFRDADSGVLLCTDVAARGLDLPQVDWIVQYNPPTSLTDYVHRVGRTARIGSKGSSLIFLLPSEANFVHSLEQEQLLLAQMTLDQVLTKLPGDGRMETAATTLQIRMENEVISCSDLHKKASQAFVSYVRSYASYPKSMRNVFCFKELHLGHLAKSYALRDPPKKITGLGVGNWVKSDERKREKRKRQDDQEQEFMRKSKTQKSSKAAKLSSISEFSSGFDGIDLSAAKKPVKAKKINYHAKRLKKKGQSS